ncbi:cytochrome P450 [Hoeflea sp. WL0058]|uniref:Cytochrome P450 n=1 Tax=Flavimaribacter sediminis TaxID=2865987 RepID=A0AAE3D0V9_9HYPH|nr:cytochrome P450 [Flavimaribacter sediminis]MBW8638184.1 cytochrome P450 [Flavimaribacter sediminis]
MRHDPENQALTLSDLPHVPEIGEDVDQLARLRQSGWAVRSDRGVEVLRYRQAVDVLEHRDLGKGATFQRRLDDIGITEGSEIRECWNRMLVTTEGGRRRNLRKPFVKLLLGPHLKQLQTAIRKIVDNVLDEFGTGPEVDLMEALAWKIPSRVYCHLVAAPIEKAAFAAHLSDSTLAPILTSDVSRRQESIDAFYCTYDFVKEHLESRRRSGLGEDFSSIMIRQFLDGHQTEDEMIYEGIALLQASVDNTVHQIGLVLGTLLEDPNRWRAIVSDETLLQPGVEEAMRLNPRFGTIFRFAEAETRLNALDLPAGTWVFISLRSANRDEAMFQAPEKFQFDRDLKRSLQFGGGPYSCLGQTLARMEIHEVVRALRIRFPHISLSQEWTRTVTNAVTETGRLRAKLH